MAGIVPLHLPRVHRKESNPGPDHAHPDHPRPDSAACYQFAEHHRTFYQPNTETKLVITDSSTDIPTHQRPTVAYSYSYAHRSFSGSNDPAPDTATQYVDDNAAHAVPGIISADAKNVGGTNSSPRVV